MPIRAAILAGLLLAVPAASALDCVVLLHGLARSSSSMKKMATYLEDRYIVANVGYPSRKKTIEQLAEATLSEGIQQCYAQGLNADTHKIHFVGHSMGGILVRFYLAHNELANKGRLVMLGPPNKGSHVVDSLGKFPGVNLLFDIVNGPAGKQLGIGDHSLPLQLPEPDYEVGIIAGTRSINLFLSLFLPNPDDGKVSVENTKLANMKDFITVPVSHPFLMKNKKVLPQVESFLRTGLFQK